MPIPNNTVVPAPKVFSVSEPTAFRTNPISPDAEPLPHFIAPSPKNEKRVNPSPVLKVEKAISVVAFV